MNIFMDFVICTNDALDMIIVMLNLITIAMERLVIGMHAVELVCKRRTAVIVKEIQVVEAVESIMTSRAFAFAF
jgi:hypothetical protein